VTRELVTTLVVVEYQKQLQNFLELQNDTVLKNLAIKYKYIKVQFNNNNNNNIKQICIAP